MKHVIVIISFFLLQAQLTSGQVTPIAEQSYSEVDALFNSTYQAHKPGAAFAIIEHGQVTYQNSKGLANLEYQLPITDTTVFHIASISKQFTTYLAFLLQEEGKLSFQDDIRDYLPELNHLPHAISIKDLTNHTHGLPNINELAHLKGVLPQAQMTHQEIVQFLLNIKQTNFKPREAYQYNNTGYILLAEIIERVDKKSFKEQLKQKIFLPLGMSHSQAVDDKNIVIQNKAYSYQLNNGAYENFPLNLSTIGASGLNTNINDLILWAKNYQNPVVGSRTFYNKMEQATYLNSGKKINYGLGLQFGTYKGLDIVFHGGGDVGYRAYILHVPKYALSILILANTNDFSPLDVVYGAIDILLEEEIKEDVSKAIKPSKDEIKQFAGTYEFQPGNYFTIIPENDTLYFQSFGTTAMTPLPALNKNTFEFPYIPYSKFIFYEDKFDFRIADFTYECFKISINPPNQSEIQLEAFTGFFRNEEYNIIYELAVVDNQLQVKRLFDAITVNPLTVKSFYAPGLGELDFVYDPNGQVKGFKLSGQNFKNLIFEKKGY
ncbi:MAG: hypothetical protein Sapg2KO_51180 [Saprospiraceae bacterium]